MLLILRDEDLEARRVALMLQGHIVAEGAEVLERECLELRRSGLRVALDLSGVIFIGRSGLEAIGRLAQAGVDIMACPPLIADMLEQEGIEVGHGKHPWKRGGGPAA